MKRILIITLGFILTHDCFSQAIIGKSYVTNANYITVESVDNSNKKFKVPLNTKFRVDGLDEKKGKVIVSFWHYGEKVTERQENSLLKSGIVGKRKSNIEETRANKKDSLFKESLSEIDVKAITKNIDVFTKEDKKGKLKLNLEYIGPWSNYLQFKMDLNDLNDKTVEYHGYSRSFTYGVMTLPVKVRFGNGNNRLFNFEENLNLGFTFGYRYQPSSRIEQAHNLLGGFGISRVKVDSVSFSQEIDLSDDTAAALMINVGYLYQHKTFQVGLFLGSDFIPSATGKAWRYQGKPWLGLALGVSLFSKDLDKNIAGINK